MWNDRRISKRKMPRLQSGYPFSIGNQTSDYREPVAIPFRFLGDCVFREKLRETAHTPRTRNDLFSRKSIYAGGVCRADRAARPDIPDASYQQRSITACNLLFSLRRNKFLGTSFSVPIWLTTARAPLRNRRGTRARWKTTTRIAGDRFLLLFLPLLTLLPFFALLVSFDRSPFFANGSRLLSLFRRDRRSIDG